MFGFFKKLLRRVPGLFSSYHYLLSLLAAFWYGFPSKRLFVVGVTGTKGKTTAVELMNSVFEAAGKKTALLSSVSVKIGEERAGNASDMTMPGRFFIQRFLRRAARSGCEYIFIEVTSQGVVQHRHRFIRWRRAFLINLHPEHVEAHGSFENYRGAKLAFLQYAASQSARVFINEKDRNAGFFIDALRGADTRRYSCDTLAGSFDAPRLFPSDFNGDNIAAAVVLARDQKIDDETTRRGLREFRGIPGRMDVVQQDPFRAIVDYAHTPDSLEAVYRTLKPKRGKLICVLGSAGGGRDKWKRPELGRIAGHYCDAIIVTDEDPYDEDPRVVMKEIENGIRDNPRFRAELSGLVWNIVDRKEAITTAIGIAQEGDTVVVTGKGSEAWIHGARGKKISWSDRDTVREALGQHK